MKHKYIRRVQPIDAIQWNPGTNDVRFTFIDGKEFPVHIPKINLSDCDMFLKVSSPDGFGGVKYARPGYYIIKYDDGSYDVMAPVQFRELYQELPDNSISVE